MYKFILYICIFLEGKVVQIVKSKIECLHSQSHCYAHSVLSFLNFFQRILVLHARVVVDPYDDPILVEIQSPITTLRNCSNVTQL